MAPHSQPKRPPVWPGANLPLREVPWSEFGWHGAFNLDTSWVHPLPVGSYVVSFSGGVSFRWADGALSGAEAQLAFVTRAENDLLGDGSVVPGSTVLVTRNELELDDNGNLVPIAPPARLQSVVTAITMSSTVSLAAPGSIGLRNIGSLAIQLEGTLTITPVP